MQFGIVYMCLYSIASSSDFTVNLTRYGVLNQATAAGIKSAFTC